MTTQEDLSLGRRWLSRAAGAISAGQDSPPSAVQFARAAAMIGSGFVALAHAAERAETSQVRQAILSLSDEPTLAAAAEREARAVAEARPHDDKPVATTPPFTRADVGKRLRFRLSGNVYRIIAVDEVYQLLTFEESPDPDDRTTESFADLVAADAEVLR